MTDGVALSIRQFSEAWRVMCTRSAGHSAALGDGVEYIFSGCPIPFFNIALVTATEVSAGRLQAQAQQACAWASTKGVPWFFVVTHEALAPGTDAAAVLDACGLTPMIPLTGMVAQQLVPAARSPAGLELTEPADDDACSALLDVNGLAYGMDLDAGKDLVGRRSFWTDHVAVLGLTGGKPACSAAVLMVDDYRYVALVATDPAQQRRGYAEAAMRRALERAATVHGDAPTFLHATDAGRPIYARMGYTPTSTHMLFMEKRFAEGH